MCQHKQTITTHISTYQHNGTKLVLTIYTCISYLFQQLRYYLCKLDFNSKAIYIDLHLNGVLVVSPLHLEITIVSVQCTKTKHNHYKKRV